jgi:hypothetical protein
MKICGQCSEYYEIGGMLWLPGEDMPQAEVCFTCACAKTAAFHKAKGKTGKLNVLHIKRDPAKQNNRKLD